MSPRNYEQSLQDILESIEKIEEYIFEMQYEEFISDRKTADAVIRNIEIIGEATKNIPPEVREEYPDVPWQEMARMRDKVIHGYFDIAFGIVWETITSDLEPIKINIQEIISSKD